MLHCLMYHPPLLRFFLMPFFFSWILHHCRQYLLTLDEALSSINTVISSALQLRRQYLFTFDEALYWHIILIILSVKGFSSDHSWFVATNRVSFELNQYLELTLFSWPPCLDLSCLDETSTNEFKAKPVFVSHFLLLLAAIMYFKFYMKFLVFR